MSWDTIEKFRLLLEFMNFGLEVWDRLRDDGSEGSGKTTVVYVKAPQITDDETEIEGTLYLP